MWKTLKQYIPRRCPTCRRIKLKVFERRINTAYTDDRLNYATLCPDCHEQEWEYWDQQWNEYWSSIL